MAVVLTGHGESERRPPYDSNRHEDRKGEPGVVFLRVAVDTRSSRID